MTESLAGLKLVGADLRGRNLSNGDHRGVDLTDADLRGADLSHADLRQAVLARARFDGATLDRTKIELMYAPLLGDYEGTPDFRPNGEGGDVEGTVGRWRVKDVDVRCPLCAHEEQRLRSAQLHTAGMTLLNLEWLGATANLLECVRCSHLTWLAAKPVAR